MVELNAELSSDVLLFCIVNKLVEDVLIAVVDDDEVINAVRLLFMRGIDDVESTSWLVENIEFSFEVESIAARVESVVKNEELILETVVDKVTLWFNLEVEFE